MGNSSKYEVILSKVKPTGHDSCSVYCSWYGPNNRWESLHIGFNETLKTERYNPIRLYEKFSDALKNRFHIPQDSELELHNGDEGKSLSPIDDEIYDYLVHKYNHREN